MISCTFALNMKIYLSKNRYFFYHKQHQFTMTNLVSRKNNATGRLAQIHIHNKTYRTHQPLNIQKNRPFAEWAAFLVIE